MNALPQLKLLTNEELHYRTVHAAGREKESTLLLLQHLIEVDARRLYLERAFSTLHDYAQTELGYSEPQASERIAAARLMARVPEVHSQMTEGNLCLTNAVKFAAHVKRENLDAQATRELLGKIVGQSTRAAQKILVDAATVEAKNEHTRPLSATLTRILFDVSEDFMLELARMRSLHGKPNATYEELFLRAIREFNRKRSTPSIRVVDRKEKIESTEKLPAAADAPATEAINHPVPSVTESAEESTDLKSSERTTASGDSAHRHRPKSSEGRRSRYIPAPVRHEVRERSGGRCEYIDTKSGRRCDSQRSLQFEHVKAFANGGSHDPGNLKQYCPAHNRWSAIQTFGRTKMVKFFSAWGSR